MILGNLFAKNPFKPMRKMMVKTVACVEATEPMFEALFSGDKDAVKEHAVTISRLEHEVDQQKQEIRSRLTSSIFTPVDRRDVLDVVAAMDGIADQAEDVGVLLTMRWMELPEPIIQPFNELRASVHEVVRGAAQVIDQVDELVDPGFSGPDAERVSVLVDEVDRLEHLADKAQDVFAKMLFEYEDDMKPAALFMWMKVGKTVGDIANSAERMCNRLRMALIR